MSSALAGRCTTIAPARWWALRADLKVRWCNIIHAQRRRVELSRPTLGRQSPKRQFASGYLRLNWSFEPQRSSQQQLPGLELSVFVLASRLVSRDSFRLLHGCLTRTPSSFLHLGQSRIGGRHPARVHPVRVVGSRGTS